MGVTFGDRIREHNLEGWVGRSAGIHLGRLCGSAPVDGKAWETQIAAVEALLIYAHSPPWNSSSIQDFGKIGELHVLNWGEIGRLLPEVSKVRWAGQDNRKPSGLDEYRAP